MWLKKNTSQYNYQPPNNSKMQRITKQYINNLTYKIIGAAIEVHKILGPGLLESNYEEAFIYELNLRGLKTRSQQNIRVLYKDIYLDCDLRYDILVEDLIIVENKAVSTMHSIFSTITLTYMKHLEVPKGILINFHSENIFRDGQTTLVNEYYADLPDE